PPSPPPRRSPPPTTPRTVHYSPCLVDRPDSSGARSTRRSGTAPQHCPRGIPGLDVGCRERSRRMLRQVRCECGYLARGRSDDDVIALILAHVATDHPDPAESATHAA